MGVREALAATTLAMVALTASAAGPKQDPGKPLVCPSMPRAAQRYWPIDIRKGEYVFSGSALLGYVDLEGRLDDGYAAFSIDWGDQHRSVRGGFSLNVDLDYEGAQKGGTPLDIRYTGWFNGDEGVLCEYQRVDDSWELTKVRQVAIRRLVHEDDGYFLKLAVKGLPFGIRLKLTPESTSTTSR